jgi:hypothetical protein
VVLLRIDVQDRTGDFSKLDNTAAKLEATFDSFLVNSAEEANAWHKAGIGNGGAAIEDPPGLRQGGFGSLYLAYLRDPDGAKLCALQQPSA